ncbi:anti-sigma factor family protein [Flindersiella endophytica]
MSEGPHLTTEGISAAFEELLSERDQRAADAHLETCERCQAVLDELILMRRALHEIGREAPAMPASVQDRLEAVLAAESMARVQSGGVPNASAEPVSEPTGAHVVSHAGADAGGSRGGRGSHRSKHVAPRGRPRSRKGPRNRRSGSGRILAVAATLVVLAVGGLVTYQTMFAGGPESNVATGPSHPASSKPPNDPDKYFIDSAPADITPQTFKADVRGAVKAGVPPKDAKDPKYGILGTRPQDCAKKLVKQQSGGLEPLSIADTKFKGKPAFLAITRSEEPNSVDAYVVTGCPGPSADVAQPKTTIAIGN